jgi:hypothetical protein
MKECRKPNAGRVGLIAIRESSLSFLLSFVIRASSFFFYNHTMNLLANEWAIKHRSAARTATQRPFAPGEYFYTLLFETPMASAGGSKRGSLAE